MPQEVIFLDGNCLSTDDLLQLGKGRYKIKVISFVVYLSVCLSVSLSIFLCLSIRFLLRIGRYKIKVKFMKLNNLSVCLSVSLSVCPFIHISLSLFNFLLILVLSVCLSFFVNFFCLFVCHSVCSSFFVSLTLC